VFRIAQLIEERCSFDAEQPCPHDVKRFHLAGCDLLLRMPWIEIQNADKPSR